MAQAKLRRVVHREPLLLLARYIARPSAERLIESGVNFLDRAGNVHLVLGRNYERTIIGNKEPLRKMASESVLLSLNCCSPLPLRNKPEVGPSVTWQKRPG